LADEMAVTTPSRSLPKLRHHFAGADLRFYLGVLAAYALATALAASVDGIHQDTLMMLAERALGGHLDSAAFKGTVDVVSLDGRYYFAVGPGQLLAYLPFAAIPDLQASGKYLVCLLFGIPAAWLTLPVARAYGAKGSSAYWVAAFGAFGSLLFYASTIGDEYYLAHAESFLALMAFLLEWSGRRRPAVLGGLLAVSFLARPTTVVVAVPFGLKLLWDSRADLRHALRTAIAIGLPIAGAVAIYGWYNWLRFGSTTEAGYALSYLSEPSLIARRNMGVFSLAQIPENLRLFLLAPPDLVSFPPFAVPNRWGMSMLLVSPALLASIRAGFRDGTARLLWIAAAAVAVPVFLYYGGGFVQYGFRYSLDFTPFLLALVAMGTPRWTGRWERVLIMLSIVSVYFGVLLDMAWHASPL
jgi:hypothetical protein